MQQTAKEGNVLSLFYFQNLRGKNSSKIIAIQGKNFIYVRYSWRTTSKIHYNKNNNFTFIYNHCIAKIVYLLTRNLKLTSISINSGSIDFV